MEEEKKDSGFVVKDKRLFDEEGKERSQEENLFAAEEKSQTSKDSPNEQKQEQDYPQVNFTNFVLSLSTTALFHFGDFPEYEGGKTEKNLPAVKQTIDILDMLNDKT